MNLDAHIFVSPHSDSGSRDSARQSDLIHKQRILVAEDDDIIRKITSNALANAGYTVKTAADGEQAWEELRHDTYDLLVTDNEMPRLTGIKLIARIRGAGMSLPIIVASDNFPMENIPDYPQLQITAVVPKPFHKFELLDMVRNVLAFGIFATFARPNPQNQNPSSS